MRKRSFVVGLVQGCIASPLLIIWLPYLITLPANLFIPYSLLTIGANLLLINLTLWGFKMTREEVNGDFATGGGIAGMLLMVGILYLFDYPLP